MRRFVLAIFLIAPACGHDGAAPPDAAVPDGATPDAAAPDAAGAPDAGFPTRLSEAGLYADIATFAIVAGAIEFEPAHALWSDGADKRRFIILPPGAQIDTSDMDHWRLPQGTKVFKEFSSGGKRLETRLIHKVGANDDPDEFVVGAYVWLADGSDAIWTPDGAEDILGTAHDVPSSDECWSCHNGEPGRLLGFSAVQLSRSPAAGTTLTTLAAANRLSHPPAPGVEYPVPGDPATAAAFGALHANCGHCHNENGAAWSDADLVLRLFVAETDAAATALCRSTMNRPLTSSWGGKPGITARIVPGDPDASAIPYRMSVRGTTDQMPPEFTEIVHADGLAAVRAWILGLPSDFECQP